MKISTRWSVCLVAAMAIYLAGCGDDDDTSNNDTPPVEMDMPPADDPMTPPADAPGTIAEVAVAAGSFGTLVDALTAADLVSVFSDADAGPFTVFAPTDDAFAAVDSAALEALLADTDALTAVLQAHVVAGSLSAADVLAATSLTALSGDELAIAGGADAPTIAGAPIVDTDIAASNGVIHVIGAVIIPEAEEDPMPETLPTIAALATEAGTFGTLLEALTAAGLAETFADAEAGPFTVFAPTDDAFAAVDSAALMAVLADVELLTSVLQAHVVSGAFQADQVLAADQHTSLGGYVLEVDASASPATIGGAPILDTNLAASNGVVHVIGAVIIPPAEPETMEELPTIADLATGAGNFSTLLSAIETAGMTALFTDASAGPFTVFAPTDAAFGAVDSAALEALLADVDGLTAVLEGHVVAGKFDASQVLAADEHTTVAGTTLAVVAGDPPTIGGAAISATDLEASNGYVHVIDSVILP